MPLLSLITAAYGPKAGHLPSTAVSVGEQLLPAGWEFEWLVQEDGESPRLHESVWGVPQVRYEANGAALGIAATRNLALNRARGDLVRVLDHDDLLLPGGLAAVLPHFTPGTWWVLSAADEIDAVGRRQPQPPPPHVGTVPRGVLGAVTDVTGRWSVLCAGLTVRIEAVRALGGWLATPRSEDVGLLTALAELGDGYVEERVSWLYRRHRVQTHLERDWQDREAEAIRLVTQRLAALRSTGLRFDTMVTR